MSKIEVLVGLPGSGKSTFVHNVFGDHPDKVFIYSTDNYIMTCVNEHGYKTYDEAFPHCIKDATKTMDEGLKLSLMWGDRVVWDQTNMSSKKRKSILSKIPKSYRKVCWCIAPPRNDAEWFELNWRLGSRAGKTIPPHIIESMADSYVEPELDEGFDYILIVDLFGNVIAEKGVALE